MSFGDMISEIFFPINFWYATHNSQNYPASPRDLLHRGKSLPNCNDVEAWSSILSQQVLRLEWHELGSTISCWDETASETWGDAQARLHRQAHHSWHLQLKLGAVFHHRHQPNIHECPQPALRSLSTRKRTQAAPSRQEVSHPSLFLQNRLLRGRFCPSKRLPANSCINQQKCIDVLPKIPYRDGQKLK